MASSLSRVISYYRSHGLRALLREGVTRLNTIVSTAIENAYWNHRGRQSLTVNGVTAEFDAAVSAGGAAIRSRHDAEAVVLEDLLHELRPNDVFYDIGANIGNYTCFAARVITNGTIVAIEPVDTNARQLERNLEFNRRYSTRIVVLQEVLSDHRGVVNFSAPQDILPGFGKAGVDPASVHRSREAISGDELVAEEDLPQPTVVKVDVEGAEYQVLKGLERTIRNGDCRVIYCEVHLPVDHRPSIEDHGATAADVRSLIESLGFTIQCERRRDPELQLKAVRRS